MKEVKNIIEQANELDVEMNKLEEDAKPATRKMQFAADDGDFDPTQRKFVQKHTLDEYGLEELALCRMILAARGSEMPDAFESKFQSLADVTRKYTMTTDASGAGAELLDTVMFPGLFQDIQSATLVAGLFEPWIPMSSKSMELPSLGDVTFYKPAGEGQAVTSTDLATAKRTITAYTLKAQVDVSDEESEDAIIAMIPEIRAILVRNAKEAIDEAILNADSTGSTSNINYYGADIGTTSRFLVGFDGLIHYCLNEVTGQKSNFNAAPTVALLGALVDKLGKYADKPERCAFVIDRWTKNAAILLDDFRTKDKMGDKATLLTGQIAQVFGIPVVLSGQIAKADANGRIDGATPGNNTKGRVVLVNRDLWRFGIRRNIRVATERSEAKTMTSVVVSMRIGLQCFGDRADASYCHTALGYNITV